MEILFVYLCGVTVFSFFRKHLLSLLLSLEFIVLSLYLNLVYYVSLFDYEGFFLIIFLCFSVCEGALGLGLLVLIIRSCGNDFFQTFNVLW